MLTYYEMYKPMLSIGCATKGTGEGKWKAKTPNQTVSFGNDMICYHEYFDRAEDDTRLNGLINYRKEHLEFMISDNFIKNVRLEGHNFIITNLLGEEFAFELKPDENNVNAKIETEIAEENDTNFKEAV